MSIRFAIIAIVLGWLATGESYGAPACGDESRDRQRFLTRDSLAIEDEEHVDAKECLRGLAWTPMEFEVISSQAESGDAARIVGFPSPTQTGHPRRDRVVLEWFQAAGTNVRRPAILVVHESGASMAIGRFVARALRNARIDAFLLHLPHYGCRRTGMKPQDEVVATIHQAVRDVRRAKDAVSALPGIDANRIHLAGISLGGFVATPAAALDRSFRSVFVLLAGSDLYTLVTEGTAESSSIRQKLADAGYRGESLRQLLATIEPSRIAHRLSAERFWLYSAVGDRVVPRICSESLAETIGLDGAHDIRLPGDHRTSAVMLPLVIGHIAKCIAGDHERESGTDAPRTSPSSAKRKGRHDATLCQDVLCGAFRRARCAERLRLPPPLDNLPSRDSQAIPGSICKVRCSGSHHAD